MQAYCEHYQQEVEPEFISPQSFLDLPGFEQKFALQSSWDWNFGQTPPFTHNMDERFGWGGVDVYLDVERGAIVQATIFSDMLDPYPMEQLAQRLGGLAYNKIAIEPCLAELMSELPQYQAQLEDFQRWFIGQID